MTIVTNIRSVFVIVFLLVTCTNLFSQNENTKTTNKNKSASFFSDSQKQFKPLNLNLIDTITKNSILNFKPHEFLLGFKPLSQNYFNPFNTTKSKSINFMSPTKSEEPDVLVKKFFNGQDMSITNFSSDYNLGTLESTSKKVRIEVRDYSLVDGDRIKVYLNEQLINRNIMLNGLSHTIHVDLRKGYNRIDIEAINEGYSGPNTAEIKVFDENGNLLSSQEWNILTGQRATLGVIRN
jgi:hypothetical protein